MADSSTVGQRFTELIQALGMSKNAFALSLDKTATVIQHIVEERNKPGFDLLCKVFEVYPNVSKDWMLQGIGQMFNSDTAALTASEPAAVAAPAAVVAAPQAAGPAVTEAPAVAPAALPAPTPPPAAPQPTAETPAPGPAAPAAPAANWEAMLYAQQLQHQLALAEQRNQHLLEQQKMLLDQQRMMQQMMEMLRPAR